MQNEAHSVLFNNQHDYYNQPEQNNGNDLQFYSSNAYDNQQVYGAGTTAGFTPPAPQNFYSGSMGNMNPQFEYNDRVTFASIKAAFGTGGYDDEPPLLEELGINFTDIKKKALVVLYPFRRYDKENMGNPDLIGPILFCLIFGSILLLKGKVHFGYIYGVASLGSIGIHLIFNLMSEAQLEPSNTGSILGYCLLPIVVLSAICTFLNPSKQISMLCCVICLAWATITATRMFITSLSMKDQIILVAYPVALLYSCFALMAMF
ncbi:hypothetical protein H8356DRAFT_1689536 [Neocallimastix lanati (nom. inval.)]|jgi:hypothetical protein|nr:hypothetical protein H8356DRAFT_1689536 [Neocallimastix sp. JGI-2020a]